jgi:hypothetical protein
MDNEMIDEPGMIRYIGSNLEIHIDCRPLSATLD